MATKPVVPTKPVARPAPAASPPVDHYSPLDRLPVPEVIEKNSDSVWALWSDVVNESSQPVALTQPADLETMPGDLETRPADLETQPADLEEPPSTLLMDLPELPRDEK